LKKKENLLKENAKKLPTQEDLKLLEEKRKKID